MTWVFHSSLPVAASSATSAPSRRPRKTRPLEYATPRLLTSQQAYWSMPAGTSGEYRHFTTPVFASTANTFLGPCDEVTKSVSPITSGVDSCDRSEPSCSTHATLRFFTLPGVIWVSGLNRVLPGSPPYTVQPCAWTEAAESATMASAMRQERARVFIESLLDVENARTSRPRCSRSLRCPCPMRKTARA